MNACSRAALLALACVCADAHAVPTSLTDLPQLTAEAPPRVPATASCTEKVLSHLFVNSYGTPGFGAHAAAACPGPWSAVILSIDVSVSGVQFDRIFDIYAGRYLLLSSSTSEPASEVPNALTHWHIDTDVSRYAGLLAGDQPITAILNNINDATYTGQYQVDLSLTFYATDANTPAAKVPDWLMPVLPASTDPAHPDGPGNYGDDGYSPLRPATPTYTQSVTLPQNLLALYADVYAQGHGACEEFWWAAPGQCGVGTPLRQVVLSIDGVIAGFAPVYPVLFTGGGGPGSWNPIPSPRAWHLDPYRLDLTPFVGRLVDGQPHSIRLDVPDAGYSDPGDFWEVGAVLSGTLDAASTQTSGALTSAPVADAATEMIMGDATNTGIIDFSASRSGEWIGYVTGSGGRVDTEVTSNFDLSTVSAVALTDSTWHWTTVSRNAVNGATPVSMTTARTYQLQAPPAGGGHFEDAATVSVDGAAPMQSNFDLNLYTLGAVEANVQQVEHYTASDSSGYCYDHLVTANAGYVVADQVLPCISLPGVGTGSGTGSTTGSSTGSTTGSTTGGDTGGSTTGSSTGSTTGDSTGSSTGSSTGGTTGTSTGATTGDATGSSTGSTSGGSTGTAQPADNSAGGGGGALSPLMLLVMLVGAGRRLPRGFTASIKSMLLIVYRI
ncbi:MAG TPA: peptide-N4-asparagine amidase [Nevskiaceae bacterium]|nr:peptide-N4-asparagine amidase [Nevskiaceae bacterium]